MDPLAEAAQRAVEEHYSMKRAKEVKKPMNLNDYVNELDLEVINEKKTNEEALKEAYRKGFAEGQIDMASELTKSHC